MRKKRDMDILMNLQKIQFIALYMRKKENGVSLNLSEYFLFISYIPFVPSLKVE